MWLFRNLESVDCTQRMLFSRRNLGNSIYARNNIASSFWEYSCAMIVGTLSLQHSIATVRHIVLTDSILCLQFNDQRRERGVNLHIGHHTVSMLFSDVAMWSPLRANPVSVLFLYWHFKHTFRYAVLFKDWAWAWDSGSVIRKFLLPFYCPRTVILTTGFLSKALLSVRSVNILKDRDISFIAMLVVLFWVLKIKYAHSDFRPSKHVIKQPWQF